MPGLTHRIQLPRPGCPTPDKVGYVDDVEATAALLTIQARGHTARRPTRTYRCPCGWWHLSSSQPRTEPTP